MTQNKLVILKTARQFPGLGAISDVAFYKNVALSGVTNWSQTNIDLYNYHTRVSPQPQHRKHPLSDPKFHLLPLRSRRVVLWPMSLPPPLRAM